MALDAGEQKGPTELSIASHRELNNRTVREPGSTEHRPPYRAPYTRPRASRRASPAGDYDARAGRRSTPKCKYIWNYEPGGRAAS